MKKWYVILIGLLSLNVMAYEWYDASTGFTWSYTIKGEEATLTGCSPKEGVLPPLPSILGGKPVKAIGNSAFRECSGFIGTLTIPNSIISIGDSAFYKCSGLTGELKIPDGVTTIGGKAFGGCTGFCGEIIIPQSVKNLSYTSLPTGDSILKVVFLGPCPFSSGEDASWFLFDKAAYVQFTEKYAYDWHNKMIGDFGSYIINYRVIVDRWREDGPKTRIVSAKMRESDPTIMDVVYKVESKRRTVKVRALAFQDGQRSFAKVVRPETFVEDEKGNSTAGNIGDNIAANVEHTLSWKVSADWDETLAKLKFDVLAIEDEILPLELVILPADEAHPKMVFSWNNVNYQKNNPAKEALFWLYADNKDNFTLIDGVLKNGSVTFVNQYGWISDAAVEYIYKKMGYEVLRGENLEYVKKRTRIPLAADRVLYAVKIIGE